MKNNTVRIAKWGFSGVWICVSVMSLGADTATPLQDHSALVKALSSDKAEDRQRAVTGLQEALRGLERGGSEKRGELSALMGTLRKIARDETAGPDLRWQAKEAFSPFLAGEPLWKNPDLLGPVIGMWDAGEGKLLVAGQMQGISGERLGWVGLYRADTGEKIWEKASDLPGIPIRFEVLPEGIFLAGLQGGGVRKRYWMGVYDIGTGAEKWLTQDLAAIQIVRILPEVIVLGGIQGDAPAEDSSAQFIRLGVFSRKTGQPLWETQKMPGDLRALYATPEAVFAGGWRNPRRDEGEPMGGRHGWLARFSTADGQLQWRLDDIPGYVQSLENLPQGLLAIGGRTYMAPSTTEENKAQGAGGMVKGRWIAEYDRRSGKALWSRVFEEGFEIDPAAQTVLKDLIPLDLNNKEYRAHLMRGIVPPATWPRVYLDEKGEPRKAVFNRLPGPVFALAVEGERVAAGGALWLALYSGWTPEGLALVWEASVAGNVQSIFGSPEGILAAGNLVGSRKGFWMSRRDSKTGSAVWEKVLPEYNMNMVEWIPQGIAAAGNIYPEGTEAEGMALLSVPWMAVFRTRDADQSDRYPR